MAARHILPAENATPLEIGLDLGLAAPVLDIPVPIRDLWRWDTCPASHLPWLAWTMSVDIWDNSWPEERKREVIRDSIALHRLKGTYGGLKRYVSLVDAVATRAIVPPQGPYWAPFDQANVDNWEATLPQVRIYPRREPGTGDGFYLDADWYDDEGTVAGGYYEENRAPEDGGDRKVFYDPATGVETEIDWIGFVNPTFGTHTELGLPGTAREDHFFFDCDFYDDAYMPWPRDAYAGVVALPPRPPEEILEGWYQVTRDTPDFIDRTGPAGEGVAFLGDCILDNGPDDALDGDYYAENEAPYQVFRRWFIFSADAAPGDPDGWSYYDDFRYGMPPHTAEIWVDIPETAPYGEAYDETDSFLRATDLTRLWKVCSAIDVSKSARDQILIETELKRRTRFGDRRRFGARHRFGEYLPRAH